MDKKKIQLGMNPSTARSRLMQDILWMLIEKNGMTHCHRCGKNMCRKTFSVEHIEPWLDSETPLELYFDLNNISFSHQSCNSAAARRPHAAKDDDERKRRIREANARSRSKNFKYCPDKRRQKYLRTGT